MIQFNSFNPTPQTQVKLEIVFTLEPHPELGLIVQVKAVERLGSGNFSMNSEKVRISNSEFYGLSEKESKILKVIESYEPDNLLNIFYKGKKRINTSIFFEKIYTEDLKNNHVRPFIDAKISEIFELLKGQTIYYWGTSTLNHWIPIVIEKSKADVEFLIERKPQGMSYSVCVFHEKKNIKVQGNNNIVVINSPACILLGSSIYNFKNGIDAKKIATFFTKSEIIVPETSEEVYLNKFIVPLVEEYNVKATGISIELETVKKEATLSFMYAQNDLLLDLTFTYGDIVYSFNTLSKGKAKLEKGKDWIIKFSKREADWEEEMIGMLTHLGFKISKNLHFSLPDNLSIESFINDKVVYLQKKGFTINQENLKQPFHLSEPVLTYTVREDNDWFDLNIIIRFGKFEIPFKKLRPHILNSNRFYELPDGSIAIIPQEWMQKLSPILDCSSESNDNVRLGRFHYNLLESFDEIGINRSGEKMKSLVNAYKKASKLETPETVKAKLRKYQSTGLQWLVALNENKFGGLLADDMGLGKTVQTLAFFEWFILNKRPEYRADFTQNPEMPSANGANLVEFSSKKKNIPFLVVAPTSLIHNWVDEIKKFTSLSHFIYMGNQRNRYVWEYFNDFEVILTTYGTIRNDKDVLSRVKFDAVVFDEAQNLKNPGSLTAKTCFDLNATQKILLTGTPIENSTSDLWSLMNIANPGILGTYTKFVKNFSQKIEKKKDMKKSGRA